MGLKFLIFNILIFLYLFLLRISDFKVFNIFFNISYLLSNFKHYFSYILDFWFLYKLSFTMKSPLLFFYKFMIFLFNVFIILLIISRHLSYVFFKFRISSFS